MRSRSIPVLLLLTLMATAHAQNKADVRVKKDKSDLAEDKGWIYNDLAKATAAAKASNKPMLVVFR